MVIVCLSMMTLCAILLTLFLSLVGSLAQRVTTSDGPIQGIAQTTNSGKTFYAYYSIPYAKPPTGSRRFLASEAPDPWTEVFDGTSENSNICYQLYGDYEQENEDCLHMNVFTPQDPIAPAESLPVMVNIHGGGFVSGSGLVSTASTGGFSPNYLLEEDVIFVSFNYRLGAFGFLSTGDDVLPGNAGFSDQILALQWVQRNIAAFGGDPERVTIFGQSAGAASVGYMLLSPRANGLFSSAILESGTSLCPWAYQRNQTEISFKTASFIDSQFDYSRDSTALLKVLQQADAKAIDNAALEFASYDGGQPNAIQKSQMQQGAYFAPIIDWDSSNPLIPNYQYESISSGSINKVPILLGICSEEGLMNLDEWLDNSLEAYDENSATLNPQDMNINNEADWNTVGSLIKQEYSPSSTFLSNRLGAIQYFTDQNFAKSLSKHAELQSQFTDVYFYEFAYTGTMSGNTEQKLPGSGNVTHTEEWAYIFRGSPLQYYPKNDQLVHNRLIRIWTNFAKYRNPTPISEELLQNIEWPKVTSENFQYVSIGNYEDTDLEIVQGKPKAARMTFWDRLYNTYGNKPYDSY